jgi:hypothetical protein
MYENKFYIYFLNIYNIYIYILKIMSTMFLNKYYNYINNINLYKDTNWYYLEIYQKYNESYTYNTNILLEFSKYELNVSIERMYKIISEKINFDYSQEITRGEYFDNEDDSFIEEEKLKLINMLNYIPPYFVFILILKLNFLYLIRKRDYLIQQEPDKEKGKKINAFLSETRKELRKESLIINFDETKPKEQFKQTIKEIINQKTQDIPVHRLDYTSEVLYEYSYLKKILIELSTQTKIGDFTKNFKILSDLLELVLDATEDESSENEAQRLFSLINEIESQLNDGVRDISDIKSKYQEDQIEIFVDSLGYLLNNKDQTIENAIKKYLRFLGDSNESSIVNILNKIKQKINPTIEGKTKIGIIREQVVSGLNSSSQTNQASTSTSQASQNNSQLLILSKLPVIPRLMKDIDGKLSESPSSQEGTSSTVDLDSYINYLIQKSEMQEKEKAAYHNFLQLVYEKNLKQKINVSANVSADVEKSLADIMSGNPLNKPHLSPIPCQVPSLNLSPIHPNQKPVKQEVNKFDTGAINDTEGKIMDLINECEQNIKQKDDIILETNEDLDKILEKLGIPSNVKIITNNIDKPRQDTIKKEILSIYEDTNREEFEKLFEVKMNDELKETLGKKINESGETPIIDVIKNFISENFKGEGEGNEKFVRLSEDTGNYSTKIINQLPVPSEKKTQIFTLVVEEKIKKEKDININENSSVDYGTAVVNPRDAITAAQNPDNIVVNAYKKMYEDYEVHDLDTTNLGDGQSTFEGKINQSGTLHIHNKLFKETLNKMFVGGNPDEQNVLLNGLNLESVTSEINTEAQESRSINANIETKQAELNKIGNSNVNTDYSGFINAYNELEKDNFVLVFRNNKSMIVDRFTFDENSTGKKIKEIIKKTGELPIRNKKIEWKIENKTTNRVTIYTSIKDIRELYLRTFFSTNDIKDGSGNEEIKNKLKNVLGVSKNKKDMEKDIKNIILEPYKKLKEGFELIEENKRRKKQLESNISSQSKQSEGLKLQSTSEIKNNVYDLYLDLLRTILYAVKYKTITEDEENQIYMLIYLFDENLIEVMRIFPTELSIKDYFNKQEFKKKMGIEKYHKIFDSSFNNFILKFRYLYNAYLIASQPMHTVIKVVNIDYLKKLFKTKSSNILSTKSIFKENEVIKDNSKMRILCNEQNLLIGMNIGSDETENEISGFCKDYFNIGPFTNVLGTNDDNINTYSAYWNVIEQIKEGQNKAIITYGFSGTGKTTTLAGIGNNLGLIKHIMNDLANEGSVIKYKVKEVVSKSAIQANVIRTGVKKPGMLNKFLLLQEMFNATLDDVKTNTSTNPNFYIDKSVETDNYIKPSYWSTNPIIDIDNDINIKTINKYIKNYYGVELSSIYSETHQITDSTKKEIAKINLRSKFFHEDYLIYINPDIDYNEEANICVDCNPINKSRNEIIKKIMNGDISQQRILFIPVIFMDMNHAKEWSLTHGPLYNETSYNITTPASLWKYCSNIYPDIEWNKFPPNDQSNEDTKKYVKTFKKNSKTDVSYVSKLVLNKSVKEIDIDEEKNEIKIIKKEENKTIFEQNINVEELTKPDKPEVNRVSVTEHTIKDDSVMEMKEQIPNTKFEFVKQTQYKNYYSELNLIMDDNSIKTKAPRPQRRIAGIEIVNANVKKNVHNKFYEFNFGVSHYHNSLIDPNIINNTHTIPDLNEETSNNEGNEIEYITPDYEKIKTIITVLEQDKEKNYCNEEENLVKKNLRYYLKFINDKIKNKDDRSEKISLYLLSNHLLNFKNKRIDKYEFLKEPSIDKKFWEDKEEHMYIPFEKIGNTEIDDRQKNKLSYMFNKDSISLSRLHKDDIKNIKEYKIEENIIKQIEDFKKILENPELKIENISGKEASEIEIYNKKNLDEIINDIGEKIKTYKDIFNNPRYSFTEIFTKFSLKIDNIRVKNEVNKGGGGEEQKQKQNKPAGSTTTRRIKGALEKAKEVEGQADEDQQSRQVEREISSESNLSVIIKTLETNFKKQLLNYFLASYTKNENYKSFDIKESGIVVFEKYGNTNESPNLEPFKKYLDSEYYKWLGSEIFISDFKYFDQNKQKRWTPNNPHSSRSHGLFILDYVFTNTKKSKILIADLAGKEDIITAKKHTETYEKSFDPNGSLSQDEQVKIGDFMKNNLKEIFEKKIKPYVEINETTSEKITGSNEWWKSNFNISLLAVEGRFVNQTLYGLTQNIKLHNFKNKIITKEIKINESSLSNLGLMKDEVKQRVGKNLPLEPKSAYELLNDYKLINNERIFNKKLDDIQIEFQNNDNQNNRFTIQDTGEFITNYGNRIGNKEDEQIKKIENLQNDENEVPHVFLEKLLSGSQETINYTDLLTNEINKELDGKFKYSVFVTYKQNEDKHLSVLTHKQPTGSRNDSIYYINSETPTGVLYDVNDMIKYNSDNKIINYIRYNKDNSDNLKDLFFYPYLSLNYQNSYLKLPYYNLINSSLCVNKHLKFKCYMFPIPKENLFLSIKEEKNIVDYIRGHYSQFNLNQTTTDIKLDPEINAKNVDFEMTVDENYIPGLLRVCHDRMFKILLLKLSKENILYNNNLFYITYKNSSEKEENKIFFKSDIETIINGDFVDIVTFTTKFSLENFKQSDNITLLNNLYGIKFNKKVKNVDKNLNEILKLLIDPPNDENKDNYEDIGPDEYESVFNEVFEYPKDRYQILRKDGKIKIEIKESRLSYDHILYYYIQGVEMKREGADTIISWRDIIDNLSSYGVNHSSLYIKDSWFGELIGEGEFQNSGGRRKPKLRLKYNLKKNQRKVVN